MLRNASLALVLLVTAFGLVACGGGGPKAEKFDQASFTEEQSYTVPLKFWMKNRGATETGIVDNVHFDDASSERVVFLYDAALGAKIDTLEQGKVYKVTFTFKKIDDLTKGHVTAIE